MRCRCRRRFGDGGRAVGVPSIEIRPYRTTDAAAVWRVHERAFRASELPFVEDAPADDDLRNVEDHYADGRFLVGELDDRVVATGAYRPTDDGTRDGDGTDDGGLDDVRADGGRAVEIRRMRVDPDHQRNGYGRSMLTALEDRARDEGFDVARLETTVLQAAARGLYESAGYEEVERRTVHGMERVVYRSEL